jgi:PilZ domain
MAETRAAFRERRRARRVSREWPVEIKNGAGIWRGTSVDVSKIGMRVRVDKRLEVRRLMLVSFGPDGSPSPLWARFSFVREIAASNEYGISFVDISQRDVTRLGELLARQSVPHPVGIVS